MGPGWALGVGLLLGALGGTAGGSHSLRYFFTGVTQPGSGLPRFSIVGYVDREVWGRYDSETRRVQPGAAWMQQEEQHHRDRQTHMARGFEGADRKDLAVLQKSYNQSGGSHILQKMAHCELLEDNTIKGFIQY
ncbi:HA1F protein, partial [Penelope pileata]|nr:HA1F protein [Penelope pileata]